MATPRLASIRLTAADGGPLPLDVRTGARPGESRPAIIICHGFKGFKDWGFFVPLAERLAVAGFTAASFNFSGSGVLEGDQFTEKDRFRRQRPSTDLKDIGIVMDHLAGQGTTAFGLVGHSRGGGLAVLTAAQDSRVKGLVTWAAVDHFLRWPEDDIARWRRDGTIDVVNQRTGEVLTLDRSALDDCDANREELDVVAAAGRIRIPWLIVHGTADPAVDISIGRRLRRASGSPRTELLEIAGADHGFGIKHPWRGSTPDFDAVLQRTVAWLAEAVA